MTTLLSRRRFLAASAAASGAAVVAPRLAFATPGDPGTGDALVVIFLRGGADGLNLVAPFDDPAYRDFRPTIRVLAPGEAASLGRPDAAEALPLTGVPGQPDARHFSSGFEGYFGFHPRLHPLYDGIWAANKLAVIPACGLPNYESTTRSHFEAMDHWERGTAAKGVSTGWVDRHLQRIGATGTLPSMVSGPRNTLMLRGATPSLAIGNLSAFGIAGFRDAVRARTALSSLYQSGDRLGDAGSGLLGRLTHVQAVDPNTAPHLPQNGATYPGTVFARGLRDIAALLRSNLGLRAATIDLGGWDTHQNMGLPEDPDASFTRLVGQLADGLAAFVQDLGPQLDEVSIVVISEFGRTAKENGSFGTDHGRGTTVFALGGGIRGGVYGSFPSEGAGTSPNNLPVVNDFRVPIAEVLENRMGNSDVGSVFPTLPESTYLGLTA
jgi:uncharacterized protein (DUF1501 family)